MNIASRYRIQVLVLPVCLFFQTLGTAQEPGANVFTSQDIGAPTSPGTSSVTGSGASAIYTLTGQGNISGTSDSGQFYYQTLTGDGTLIAQVTGVTGAAAATASAGIMVRASNAANSAMMYIDVSKSSGVYKVLRTTSGGTAVTNNGVGTAPYWVKLVRAGASFTGYTSSNGTTWTQIGSTTTMSWADTVNIGLAATSSGTDVVTGTFTNVTLTQSNSLGNGSGLFGEYFNAANLTARRLTRIDPTINFNWSGTTPAPVITSSAFSARWTGTIIPRYSESYTIKTLFTGGVRVWVYPLPIPSTGQATPPIIDSWTGSSGGNASGTVSMIVGHPYRIEVDFSSAGQGAPQIALYWYSTNQTPEITPLAQLAPPSEGKGRVLDEKWLSVTGSLVSNLTSLTSYPNTPTGRHFLTSLDIGFNNNGADFGDKMSGYIYPPETGNYTFYVSGDDEAQLWLSASESPTNLTEVCNVPAGGFTSYLQWNAYPSQTSGSVYLYASQRYYFEVLHKQGSGSNNCAVGWQTPSGIVEQPIPGERVAPYEAVTFIPTQASNFACLATGHPRLFTDAQGFSVIKTDALTTTPAQTQRNLWYVGTGGVAATATNHGTPVSGSLLYQANSLFAMAPTQATPDGTGYYATSYLNSITKIQNNVSLLGLAYQLSGNTDYLNRAWEELDCASGDTVTANASLGDTWTGTAPGWPSWGATSGDLGYAEMTSAFAIGYDWLYNGLSGAQIHVLEQQVVVGLSYQNAQYGAGTGGPNGDIYYGNGNHTAVNAGGQMVGAVAIANDPPTTGNPGTSTSDNNTAATALNYAYTALNTPGGLLSELGPDGCDPESPDYQNYMENYLGLGFSALETANGGAAGFTQIPGQVKVASCKFGLTGPRSMFPYGDSWPIYDSQHTPAEFWYGWKFDEPSVAWDEIVEAPTSPGVSPFDVIWYDARGLGSNSGAPPSSINAGLPLDTQNRVSDIMSFRSSYDTSTTALYAAIKGGDNTTGHAHLAQGTFFIQTSGAEWASLLGKDSYSLYQYFQLNPSYSPVNRWDYYRCRAEGGNTLVIGPNPSNTGAPDQNCGNIGGVGNSTAQSRVIKYSSTPTLGETILNMSALYPNATQTLRGLQLNRPVGATPYVVIQDEVTAPANTSIYWFMHYQYKVRDWLTTTVLSDATKATEVDGSGGPAMFLKILSPPGATFYITEAAPLPTSPNPTQTSNANAAGNQYWRKLAIHYTPTTTGTTTICVEIIPGGDPGTYPTVTPLKSW